MIKQFYKSLLISILSFSLININIYAQDGSDSTPVAADTSTIQPNSSTEPNAKATAQMSKSAPSNLTRDANGVLKSTETHKIGGTGEDTENQMLTSITMLAIGVIGTKLLMYQKWTTDMTIVAAASAAYIAAEIANVMNLKKQLKDMELTVTRSSDGKIDQAQIETIEKLKESYEKVKKSSQTRKMLQMAAFAAYGVAVGVAGWQRFTEDGQFASCEVAMAEASTELKACAANVEGGTEAASCALCDGMVTDLGVGLKGQKVKEEALPVASTMQAAAALPADMKAKVEIAKPCSGATASAIKAKTISHACATYIATKKAHESYGKAIETLTYFNKTERILYAGINLPGFSVSSKDLGPIGSLRMKLEQALDLIMPKAEASYVSLLGLAGGAALAYFGAQHTLSQTLDGYIFTPGGRILIWTGLAGAAYLAANATQSEIDKIDDRLKEIDKILKDLSTLKKGIKANNVQDQQINLASAVAMQEDLQLSVNGNTKTDCLTKPNGANCTKLTDTLKAMPDFANLPDSLKMTASQAATMGDGLSGTGVISGSTLSNAASLAGRAGAIANLGKLIKNKINDGLMKAGKPSIDFDKREKAVFGSFLSKTKDALKSKGMTSGAFLASTGISPVAKPESGAALLPSPKKGSAIQGSAGSQASGGKAKEGMEFRLDNGTEFALDNNGAGADNKNGNAQDAVYDIGNNDISPENGESIFKLISNRYIKSAYPKLLEEIPVKN